MATRAPVMEGAYESSDKGVLLYTKKMYLRDGYVMILDVGYQFILIKSLVYMEILY